MAWGIWGSYCNIPKAIFYLLKGDYRLSCGGVGDVDDVQGCATARRSGIRINPNP